MVSSTRNRLLALTVGLFLLVLVAFASGLPGALSSAQAETTSCGAGFTDNPNDATTTDLVCIPDANLLSAVDKALGLTAGTQVTVAQAQGLTKIPSADTGVPIANLTGLQVFTSLTELQLAGPGNTFTDLTPIGGLTQLTGLTLNQDLSLTSVGPISGLTKLTTLSLALDKVNSVAPLSGMTSLTSLALTDDNVSDVSQLPVMPNATSLVLLGNRISDISPLAEKLAGAGATFKTLNIGTNRIADVSLLAPLGETSRLFGVSVTLTMTNDRIKDFSAFSNWIKKPTA